MNRIINVAFTLIFCATLSCRKKVDMVAVIPTIDYVWDESMPVELYSCQSEDSISIISTPNMAVQIAYVVLVNVYGTATIDKELPFRVNLRDDVWIIEGHFDDGRLGDVIQTGGVAHIEIKKSNGEITKVIHTK